MYKKLCKQQAKSEKNFQKVKLFRKNAFLEERIRGVREGDCLQMPLSQVNEKSYRSKVAQLNKADGYQHYSIAVSESMNILGVINNGHQ